MTMRPIQTRFRCGSAHRLTLPLKSNSPARYAKSTPSHPKVLRPLVGVWFQVLFHSPSGVLFTFPSRYLSAIGHQGVLSLGGWSPRIQTTFHGCGPTQGRHRQAGGFRLRDDCPLWCEVPLASTNHRLCNCRRIGHDPDRRPITPTRQRVSA